MLRRKSHLEAYRDGQWDCVLSSLYFAPFALVFLLVSSSERCSTSAFRIASKRLYRNKRTKWAALLNIARSHISSYVHPLIISFHFLLLEQSQRLKFHTRIRNFKLVIASLQKENFSYRCLYLKLPCFSVVHNKLVTTTLWTITQMCPKVHSRDA